MPTTRQRYLITESDRLKAALDDAARRWPEEKSRAKLLVRLAEEGHDALGPASESAVSRRAAIERTGGLLTGAYEPGYLESLRREWPA
ncbi:hypothetical protein [uncultured Friedmanniella sp.]|uniref:hypothetical protein n=1 Tax=uncultured Friedmanniella sp. TaxID=335381 RepID=UPI0035C9C834